MIYYDILKKLIHEGSLARRLWVAYKPCRLLFGVA